MDGSSAYFGDDFGQKIDLTVRIREILRNYPEGTSIFKELVQNADDAGATEVAFCLDLRQHSTEHLAYNKMEKFQGPALVVYNNATFSDTDFQSIQRIGDSLKKDTSKGWKTGRFGVGFNSVYHLTDLPAFVSGSHLVFFDPQACHLPNVNPSNPGKMIDFVSHPELVLNYPDQVAPFRMFGCDFERPFDGTLFRLALRSEEHARESRLSSRPQSTEHMMEMLSEFEESIHLVLLFLRNVSGIKLMTWKDGETEPTLFCEASISNLTDDIRAKRSLQASIVSTITNERRTFDSEGQACDYPIDIAITKATKSTEHARYVIANQLGGGKCSQIANDPANASQRLVPWGGVAVRISDFQSPTVTEEGLAFCFLPLPTHTYLPVHVNGYFELSSNRRDIWFGEGLSGEGLVRAQWNMALLEDVVSPCYARALLLLTDGKSMTAEFHATLFPKVVPPAPWDAVAQSVLDLVRVKPCLFSPVDGGVWITPAKALIVKRTTEDYERFVRWLQEDGVRVVSNLSEEAENVLVKLGAVPTFLKPTTLRSEYKLRSSKHAGNQGAIRTLISFLVADVTQKTLGELVGVKLLPLGDGTLGTIQEARKSGNAASLDYLCSMGFSRAHSMTALRSTGGDDVESALNWLFAHPNAAPLSTQDESMAYFIPTADERRILFKAQQYFVEVDALPEAAVKLLASAQAQQELNVRQIDMEVFVDLLAVVLPQEWSGKASIPWEPEKEAYRAFDEEWFRLLWRYIGPSNRLQHLQDKWPILPTESGVLRLLSPTSGVVSPELLPPSCLAALIKIGVPVLLKNLFATVQPHPDVWKFVNQPTPSGVLSSLVELCEAPVSEVKTAFGSVTRRERDQLRSFLLTDSCEDLDDTQKMVFSKLPIFEGVTAIDRLDEHDALWTDADDHEEALNGYSPTFVGLYSATRRSVRVICPGIKWTLLDDNFLMVKGDDKSMISALERFGVRVISRAKCFGEFLIPRLESMPAASRVDFVSQLLQELGTLLAEDQDGDLARMIETSAIFPAVNGDMKRIIDLFDPEIDEFSKIMDDSFFPAIELQDPQPLSVLRSLGLQRHLSRRSVLDLACSLDADQSKILQGGLSSQDESELGSMLRGRATEFFRYLDSHIDQLVSISAPPAKAQKRNIKTKGLKLWRTMVGDESNAKDTSAAKTQSEESERRISEQNEIDDFVAKLNVISWVPVCDQSPHPAIPWCREDSRVVVAAPGQTRLPRDLGLCSSQFYIVGLPIHSDILRDKFQWSEPIPVEVIAQQLKAIALTAMEGPGDRQRSQIVWPIMFEIYKALSRFFEQEATGARRGAVLASLGGDLHYVWVGGRFVAPHRVALSTVVNAEPYLFATPSELVHFRPFLKAIGVRERFTMNDYVNALAEMHTQSLIPLHSEEQGASLMLSKDELVSAIGLVQLISDTLAHHSDYELYVPDANGRLARSVNLTFDDAPWLDKRDVDVTAIQFVHPKISNEVAMKTGAKSLRGQLLHANQSESLQFSMGREVEAFGQSEALTKRISHILEQYPDGPHIISELIQNADDAGATRVCLLYSDVTYGTSSLLSPAMAKWQGPALYCYNDAEFQESDFISLAQIGQGGKLQKVSTTGRFGLGFNSVYHFTDLPSVLSANSLVMFDPHATHLPGITPANPGIKVRFVNSSLPKQFPDQFEPFKMFGCDFTSHFHGSLFRFPLRHEGLAPSSEIKQRAYAKEQIQDLFESFRATIADAMIFLRNVRKVDVMIQLSREEAPELLFSSEVPENERGEAWRQIDRFISGSTESRARGRREPSYSSKRAFYSRLARASPAELPSVTQTLHIQTRERKNITQLFNNAQTDVGVLTTDERPRFDTEWMARTDEYLVCNQVGGGRAREIACAPENESLKLIPWVGIAGRLQDQVVEGRAFCFLPLPVRTGLPVHVNGYFELSSNRRDIWHGDDLSGDGKLRSQWNEALLTDAVAPAYAAFLQEAQHLCGRSRSTSYYSLLPTKLLSAPWHNLVRALFGSIRDKPLLWTSPSSARNAGKPVTPASCVVIDDRVSDWEVLEASLNAVFIETVRVPHPLREVLTELDTIQGTFTPSFFRKMIRSGRFLPSLDSVKVGKVIKFCLSDCGDDSARAELNDLPIVPVLDGSYKPLLIHSHAQEQPVEFATALFFANEVEQQLLDTFRSRLVSFQFKEVFDTEPAVCAQSNLFVLDLKSASEIFLSRMLPAEWRESGAREVFLWEPDAAGNHPSRKWLQLWWDYVESTLDDASGERESSMAREAVSKWPLLPVVLSTEGSRGILIHAGDRSKMAVVHHPTSPPLVDATRKLPAVLTKLGVATIDSTVVKGSRTITWLIECSFVFSMNLDGFLSAFSHRLKREKRGRSVDEVFAVLEEEDRMALEGFVTSANADSLSEDNVHLLHKLPIFRVHAAAGEDPSVARFQSIADGAKLPGEDTDPRILGSTFFVAPENSKTRSFLRGAGVDEWSATRILLEYFFPRLGDVQLQENGERLIDSVIQNALMEVPFHQRHDPTFRDTIKSLPIIPTRKRQLRRISDLYDPNNRDLGELVGPNSLPDESFSGEEMVSILRHLGLRSSLSCHAILESARSVEALASDGESQEEAYKKAQSLLKVVNRSFDEMALSFSELAGSVNDVDHVDPLEGIVDELRVIRWLPVHGAPLRSMMPWQRSTTSDGDVLASATITRPEKDAWSCSSTHSILKGQLHSEVLAAGFGWNDVVEATTVATQLAAVGEMAGSSNGADISSPDFKLLVQETQKLYQMLDASCCDPDLVDRLRETLDSAAWVWTGKVFATMQQVALEADSELEPLLYSAPPEVLVPRSLLHAFGLKNHFEPIDYLLALRSLSDGGNVLTAEERTTCLKLLQLIADALSTGGSSADFTASGLLLLDDKDRLVPVRDLVYDDMEWNESSEARRGCRFVSRSVPRDVALRLGAKSLHSKLAETSVSSVQLTCPGTIALKAILPKRDRWFEAFFTEILLAVERFGGSQVEFFADFRKHPAQRIIQPSFETLQEEAICVHIHDLVLSSHDVNALFAGEMSRPGLLTGFVFSDCLQILSGDGFYVMDPTRSFLSSSSGASASDIGLARRYDILSEEFTRYPDQLLPFCTLPSCPGNISGGTRSTLLRFPWRKEGSSLSGYKLSSNGVESFVRYVRSELVDCLVFTESVHRVALWSVGKGSEFAVHAHGEAALVAPEVTLKKRNSTRQSNEWKKKFTFHSFFKAPIVPENQVEFLIKIEIENRRFKDTWLLSDIMAAGRSRDLAATPVHEVLNSIPYVGVACRLFRNGDIAPPVRGRLFKIVKTGQDIGLPIHINGCFKKHLGDSLVHFNSARSGMNDEQSISTHWNRVLLEDGVVEAYVKMLQSAKLKFENSVPKAFYRVWPSAVKASNIVAAQTQLLLYRKLDLQQFFLCTDGVFRTLGGGYVVDMAGMDLQVVSFAQLNFPSFDIPSTILDDAKRLLPSRVSSLSPRTMRRFLRNFRLADLHASMCLSLLEYCLSDLTFPLPGETHPVWTEFQGLPLLPLQNGSVGLLGTSQRGRYVLASFNQIQLLSPLTNMFVALEARQRLHAYFSEPRFVAQMGLSQFSIKTLSDHIHSVIPAAWKNRAFVDWSPESDPSHVTRVWMYRFWNEVRFERRSLQYFRDWPLIPVQGSRLLSCGKPDAAVCVWDGAFDRSLRDRLSASFQSDVQENEEKLAEFEAERKRLRELAAEKLVREERQELFQDDEADQLEDVAFGDPDDEDDQPAADTDGVVEAEVGDVEVVETAVEVASGSGEGTNDDEALDPGIEPVAAVAGENGEAPRQVQLPVDLVGDAVAAGPAILAVAEYCSRETLHNLLFRLNAPLLELAYIDGQESDIIPSSRDAAIVVLDGISSADAAMLTWAALSAAEATTLAEYFGDHSARHGGFNRLHLDRLKCLPVYVNISGVPCALDRGEHFLVPAEVDLTAIPLPPSARERCMLPNPRLTAFYKDLGVEDMGYGKLLLSLLPSFVELLPDQREAILRLIKGRWQSLRGEADVVAVLRSTPLFVSTDGSYKCADSYLDPRNKVLKVLYADVQGIFPSEPIYSSDEWLNLMGEIGLRSEITVDLFVECAQRLEDVYANKATLSVEDEAVINTLHEYFVQNFDKYDRSRVFYERIASIRFVPAIRYENAVSGQRESSAMSSRTVLATYAECATPDDQALAFSSLPILATSALPPRVLWSRLGLQSPPPKTVVLEHLFFIVERASQSTIAESWQFFIPVVDVFQALFKYLQDEWDHVTSEERIRLTNTPIIPVGSHLVKGNRLFFHLAENLAPLMYEVPRVFGAYDKLFHTLGSKDAPNVQDYVLLLRDLSEECGGSALNLNELLSVARVVNLLADGIAEQNKTFSTEALQHLYLPSTESVMCQALQMAHNDAPWICSRVDLTELQVVHPRVTPERCSALGVKGISHVVSEELETACQVDVRVQQPREVQNMNAIISSQPFGNGLRTIISVQQQKSASPSSIDFEDLDRRIVGLARYQIRAVETLKSRFIAKLGHPVRRVDVTKASVATGSISFIDETTKIIYVAVKTLEAHPGVRVNQVVASCMNQLLGGFVQDCSAMESILSCDAADIQPMLRFLHIHEDPALIMENLRGSSGEPLCESDLRAVELAPLRSFYVGEVVAVESEGELRYAKILKEESSPSGISQFEVRVRQAEVKWYPATQIYCFKSSREQARPAVASSENRNRAFVERLELHGATQQSEELAGQSATSSLPASVVVHGAGPIRAPEGVPAVTVVSAVNDLLSKLNMSLDTTYEELIAENLRLQRRLDQAEEGRRLASSQVEDAIREKKDAQDSLTCMICLENKVDRVLIPCGHIYCGSCIGQLPRQTCPICRQTISATSAFHVPS